MAPGRCQWYSYPGVSQAGRPNDLRGRRQRYAKSRIRILARHDAAKVFGPSESLSICFAFPEAKHAHRLLREGAFIHSTHCRTSIYKPKRS